MSLRFDFRDFQRAAANLGAFADQIPFALSKTLNEAAAVTRKELIGDTWPKHVQVRNRAFLGAALRREFATKKSLRIAIAETGPAAGKGNLALHSEGGARRARRANLAIPSDKLKSRRTGKGVPKGMRPSVLPNSFRKGDVIYQRVGPKKRNLKLVYVLRPSVNIPAAVPFESDFARVMRREVGAAFGANMRAAMATRRKSSTR